MLSEHSAADLDIFSLMALGVRNKDVFREDNRPKTYQRVRKAALSGVSLNIHYLGLPDSLGRLEKLIGLSLGDNLFSGVIPSLILNKSSLELINFRSNQLEGGLASDIGITLPRLVTINIGQNHLKGPIPPSFSNATKLLRLILPKNEFSGTVPDLRYLNQLQWVSISVNQLGRGAPGDLRFVESLNSTDLQLLAFNDNNFGGMLPQSICNLSSKLDTMSFESNRLTGTIPSDIGNLRNLETLYMGYNQFASNLPDGMGGLHKLKFLRAQTGIFTGEIPSSLGNMSMVTVIALRGNSLSGSIPPSLGNCQNLIGLDLSENNLTGHIPSEVFAIGSSLYALLLSRNRLSGPVPNEVAYLNRLGAFYVHENRLLGKVPSSLGQCESLVELSMNNNEFEGDISSFLKPLKALQVLDLSLNKFSGKIPKFLGNFQLTYINLSFNHFEGEVPEQGIFLNASAISVMGNKNLCGGILELNLPRCPTTQVKQGRKISHKTVIIIATGSSILMVVSLLLMTYIWMRRKTLKPRSELMHVEPFPQLAFQDVLKATSGFNQSNLIGTGSFGTVYKGILENEDTVAIKVLDLQNRAASKSFIVECNALRNIRHRNLVKIITACSTIDFHGNDFKALVYEYMENGSLERWLHPEEARDGAHVYTKLSLANRLSIAIDMALALEYLHHDCEMPIIHCDLKPSNILLDADLTAHLGDFGLARILTDVEVMLQSSSIGVKGTVGYSPPEYGMGSKVSREGDMYSYGILLLEMMTGKRPTDEMFQDTWNIRSYCEAALPERVVEIADPDMFHNEFGVGARHWVCTPSRMQECLVKVFEIGTGCCQETPGERMDIHEAAARLRSVKLLVH